MTFSEGRDMAESVRRIRLILAGDMAVGKTSVILNYAQGVLARDAAPVPTCGVDFKCAPCSVDGVQYMLHIWDTAGQERFHSVSPSYFRRADGVLLFYSVDSRDSFAHLGYWKRIADQNKSGDTVPVIVVGNKTDLTDKRVIDREEGERWARELECLFIETSAMTGEGVREAFQTIATAVARSANRQLTQPMGRAEAVGLDAGGAAGGMGCC
jgi:Ras-related protein Rab-18